MLGLNRRGRDAAGASCSFGSPSCSSRSSSTSWATPCCSAASAVIRGSRCTASAGWPRATIATAARAARSSSASPGRPRVSPWRPIVVAAVRLDGPRHRLDVGRASYPWDAADMSEATSCRCSADMLYWEPFASAPREHALGRRLAGQHPVGPDQPAADLPARRRPRVARGLHAARPAAGHRPVAAHLDRRRGRDGGGRRRIAWQSLFTALMFGYLAYTSYRTLQAYQVAALVTCGVAHACMRDNDSIGCGRRCDSH